MCECGHDLGAHLPDPNRPFAWPCRICGCTEYRSLAAREQIYRAQHMHGKGYADSYIAQVMGVSELKVRYLVEAL
jgi:hypothetical protein